MKKETLLEANNLDNKIKCVEERLKTINEQISELNNGTLVLLLSVRHDGLIHDHRYETKDKEFDYILSAIKARYAKDLNDLKEQFDKL